MRGASLPFGVRLDVSETVVFETLEGVGLIREGELFLVGPTAEESVSAVFDALVGRQASVVAHHCPPDPPQEGQPGGGSCLIRGECPAGHHYRPNYLYSFQQKGLVEKSEGRYLVAGHEVSLEMLEGHHSLVVVAALPALQVEAAPASLEDLQQRLQQCYSLLSQVNARKDSL